MKRRIISILLALALLLSLNLVTAVQAVGGDVTVTPASGGGAISADTAGVAWTDLGAITISEGATGDIAVGDNVTLILITPDGFMFNMEQTPSVSGVAGDITNLEIAIATEDITVTLTATNTTALDSIVIGGSGIDAIQVMPYDGTPLLSGNIIRAGISTAVIAGIDGSTNFGTLAMVPGAADHFAMETEHSGTETAGVAFSVTLTAKDQFDNTTTSYAGSKGIDFTSSATAAPDLTEPTIPSTTQTISFASGVGTSAAGAFTLVNAGEMPKISATDTTVSGESADITVNPGVVDHFAVETEHSGTETAGVSFSVTLTAKDQFDNTTTSYAGSKGIRFTSTAIAAPDLTEPTIPSTTQTISFASGVGTSAAGAFTLVNAGETPTISAGDDTVGGESAAITVNPGAAVSVDISPDDVTITADDSQEYFTEAVDDYENPFDVTGSTFFSIDPGAEGWWTDNEYQPGVTGVWTVTGVYDFLSDNTSLTVNPGEVVSLDISGVHDTVAGEHIGPVEVQALDAHMNYIPGLEIDVSLQTGTGWLSGTTTNTTAEDGIATFNNLSIDLVGEKELEFSANGVFEYAGLDILPGEATSFVFGEIDTPQDAGVAFSITITAKDKCGNKDIYYEGQATLSDLTGTIEPYTCNFTAGVWMGPVTIYLPHESNIITADDGEVTGDSNSFTVNPYPVYNITTGQGYLTIQGAIDDASPGDIIEVSPGEYNEFLSIDKSLTLWSAAGPEYTTIHGAVGIELGYADDDVTPLAETVVFGGFYIWDSESLIYIAEVDWGSSLTIGGNILAECGNGIYSSITTVNNESSVTIEGNCIYNYAWNGILLESIVGGSEVIIRDNEIAMIGMMMFDGSGISIEHLAGGSTVTIEDNLIAQNGVGVEFCDVYDSTIIIAGNTIGFGYSEFVEEFLYPNYYCGIYFGGDDTVQDSTITIGGDTPEEGNVIIGNGHFNGISGGGIYFEAYLEDDSSVEILNNYIWDNTAGVYVHAFDEDSTVDIHYNNIAENGFGVFNDDGGDTIDATCNWWDDATGPENPSNPHGEAAGDQVSGGVEFIPWYATDTTNPTTENVSVDHPGHSIIALSDTIQGGVDAALAGDTVIALAGTYNEQVFINKPSLTVQGDAGADATIIDGTGVTNNSPQQASLVWLQQHCITFKGFTLQNYPQAWVGENCINGAVIWVQGYDGGLTDGIMGCLVTENKVNGSPEGIPGILATGGAGGNTISYNEILDSGAEGILFRSDADTDANNICYNTITNSSSYGICLSSLTLGGEVPFFHANGIFNNEISGGTHGIGIREVDSFDLSIEIQRNYIHGVVSGEGEAIEIYKSRGVHVRGNTLEGNGTGIQITDYEFTEDWTECYARYNNISGNTACGVEAVTCTDNFTATHNWWGDASGPHHDTTNPSGTGDDVTDEVDYSHWFGAAITGYWSQYTTSGNFTVNATGTTDTEVLKTGTGTPGISVIQFTGNPGGSSPSGFAALGRYIDVHIDNPTDVTEIEIRSYYTSSDIIGLNEATLKLSWWDGTEWTECSDSGATYPAGGPTYRGYIWAVITEYTTPSLFDLTGTPFMSMGKLLPDYSGFEFYYLQMNLLGTKQNVTTSYSGRLDQTLGATSADGTLTINIPEGTVARDKNGNRLTTLDVTVNEDPPPPPENKNIIGLTYNFEPDGATFDPPITLTFTYDPETLPEGVAEEDLVLALYDEETGEWVELECTVDTENNIITAVVSHFTDFAIIGAVTQPPPPPPAPAAFLVSSLSVEPAEVEPNEAVTVSVSVANTGGTEGSYTVVLMLNGVKEAEKGVTVDAGASLTVSFSVTREEAGTCTVAVDGLSASFAVVAPTPPPPPAEEEEEVVVVPEEEEELIPEPAKPINWSVVGGIIGGAVLVIVLITLFWIRRRAYKLTER